MAEKHGCNGKKKFFFNNTIRIYLTKNCFRWYAVACDEQHFQNWLKKPTSLKSLKRGFGNGKSRFRAVKNAIHTLKNNPKYV